MLDQIYRGDIFYITNLNNSNRVKSSEQESGRPAVVVSNDKCNEHSNVIEVVYLTTQEKKPLPTHVEVICYEPSTALCEQVHSINKGRLGEYIRTCTDAEMKAIDDALMVSLGLTENKTEPKGNLDGAIKALNEQVKDLETELKRADDYAAMLEIKLKETALKGHTSIQEPIQVTPEGEWISKEQFEELEAIIHETNFELGIVTGERNAYKQLCDTLMNK